MCKQNVSSRKLMLVSRYGLISTTLTLFATLHTILAAQTWKGDTAHCTIGTTGDGLKLANCSGTQESFHDDGNVIIPWDLPDDIEVIDLSNKGGAQISEILFLDENPFENYKQLKRIIMRSSRQFKDSNPNLGKWDHWGADAMKSAFKDLSNLEYLEMSDCNLNEKWYPITFPKNIKTLNMSRNILSSLNLQSCTEIEEINLNDNLRLQNIPVFHYPLPPIKTLRLKQCPLDNMTILDIAGLCELTLLELDFPKGSSYLTEAGYCKCKILKQWVAIVKVKGVENVKCAAPPSKGHCPESILQEAEGRRDGCPLLKPDDPLSITLLQILKYIFFLVLLLMILATVILYVIRHFHLREFWAAHHPNMFHSTPIKPEEEEEEEENSFKEPEREERGSSSINEE